MAVDGRLEWRGYEARDGGKRQAVEIIAETVQFLGPASDAQAEPRAHAREPDSGPPVQPPSEVSEDEIPF